MAPVRGLGPGWIRLAFVLGALLGGLGIVVYLACWLIIPADGSPEDQTGRTVIGLAQAFGACAGLAVLALGGGTATVFGFGWAVLVLAGLVLVGVLAGWRRAGPAWALLPVAALTLPAIAVATTGLRLAPQAGTTVVAPADAATVRGNDYRSGLGMMLIDLRGTRFPASGVVPLRIDAGVRRTIVALPQNACVRVLVDYHVNPFAVHLAGLLTGRTIPTFSDVVLFGRVYGQDGRAAAGRGAGPVLAISFRSQGGSLYVRDYPSAVDPQRRPDWPGYPVHLESRPNTRGVPKRAARALIRSWHARLTAERASRRQIDAQMPGPCR